MDLINEDKLKAMLDEAIDRTNSDATKLLAGLDGWTITIPAITITLNKPK